MLALCQKRGPTLWRGRATGTGAATGTAAPGDNAIRKAPTRAENSVTRGQQRIGT
jgi:hypothetical protein